MDNYEKLEVKLMYQEDTINQLNDLVVEMQKGLLITNKRIESLKKKIEDLEDGKEIENRKPPHY